MPTRFWLIVATVALAWLPIVILSAPVWRGDGMIDPLLLRVEPHARLLGALTLLLVAQSALDRRVTMTANSVTAQGLLRSSQRQQWQAFIARLRWLHGDRVFDLCWMTVVYGALVFAYFDCLPPRLLRWLLSTLHGVQWADATPAWWWYVLVAQPLLLLVLGRWMYRWVLWGMLVYRLAAMGPVLRVSHGDRVGGLGFLRVPIDGLQGFLLAVGLAIASVWFDEIAADRAQLATFTVDLLGFLLVCLLLMILPYLGLSPLLVRARDRGVIEYGELMHHYAVEFEQRWLGRAQPPRDDLLGHADFQSLGDLRTVAHDVEQLRVLVPNFADLKAVLLAALLPFLLVALAHGPTAAELVRGAVVRFIGG
jgi:hypothetical protein